MVGDRLKKTRKEKGLSQKELAELLDTSQGYISDIEKGHKMPGGDFLIALSIKCGVDINWLLTGEGEQNPLYEYRVSEGATNFKIEGKNKGRDFFVSSNSSDDNVAIIIDEMHRAMIDLMDSAPKEKNELVALVKGYLMGKQGKKV